MNGHTNKFLRVAKRLLRNLLRTLDLTDRRAFMLMAKCTPAYNYRATKFFERNADAFDRWQDRNFKRIDRVVNLHSPWKD